MQNRGVFQRSKGHGLNFIRSIRSQPPQYQNRSDGPAVLTRFRIRVNFPCFSHLGISSSLHNSSHDSLGSQLAGFSCGLSRPTPPVKRNRHSASSISRLCFNRFTHSSKENSNCKIKSVRSVRVHEMEIDLFYFWQIKKGKTRSKF